MVSRAWAVIQKIALVEEQLKQLNETSVKHAEYLEVVDDQLTKRMSVIEKDYNDQLRKLSERVAKLEGQSELIQTLLQGQNSQRIGK